MHAAYLIRGVQSTNQEVSIVMNSCRKQGTCVRKEIEITEGKGAGGLIYP